MEFKISFPPCKLPGDSSSGYPKVKSEVRSKIKSLVSSQPYSLGSEMAGFAVPIVHNLLLTLRPQFSGIQEHYAAEGQTVCEHTQPAIFSHAFFNSDDHAKLSSVFTNGIHHLLQQGDMQGTADSWMSTITAAFDSLQSNGQPSSFVWITESAEGEDDDDDDDADTGWILIEIYPDGSSVLLNWNIHPSEDYLIAINRFESIAGIREYLIRMLARDTGNLHSGFFW